MKRLMKSSKMFMALLTFTIVLFIPILIASFLAMGAGYLLNLVYPIGIFAGCMLFIATTGVGILGIGMIAVNEHLKSRYGHWHMDDDGENEDEDIDYFDEEDNIKVGSLRYPGVGRNQPCPCGSK